MGRHAGTVAFVTGAAHGIGRAIVARLVAEGARVGFCDVDDAGGRAVADELGPAALFVPADVTDEDQIAAAVAAVSSRFGGVTVLVNNAGVNAHFELADLTVSEWDRFLAIDLRAAWLCAKFVIPGMRTAGGGAVVNVSSLHAKLTTRGMFPYAAAKAGLVGLTRSMAVELGPDGVRVNAVCPGWTRTGPVEAAFAATGDPDRAEREVAESCPLGRLAEPDEIAAVVAFAASAEATYMTGTELYVDGGLGARFAT
ncbi:SDR family NAD(P)-dependent oxidoreductase [Jiangella mangrovi]|uniref:NAD(P)-dependent dehydrogenase (Short-subunit alcohol dehydrogenase family) n=1 Tax=Jiangella mangrovi TaxID=1524084 RepID=A0A7W9GWE0_9ACTN|nr:SDR family oxidoreductase [Jiangella mangrovi]MBB5791011.1 NAD(P)-dependent dehydrogenase (short-subunit alcohol dehydrogenase family) [Jiangella mangrovi]